MKNIILWVSTSVISWFILITLISLLTNIRFYNIWSEFEVLLISFGFSMTLATLVTCTSVLKDEIRNNKK